MNTLPVVPSEIPEGVKVLWDYVRKDKPKKLRDGFTFKEPLTWGWMLPYLLRLDELTWGRWVHWGNVMQAGKLIDEPIPKIVWTGEDRSGPGRKMLEKSLETITKGNGWQGWSSWTYFDYFLDWLLFGLGDNKQMEEPKPPGSCEGASERLYQIFNLEPMLAFPHDYFGDIMAENEFGRRSGFYPTPMCVCEMMVKMQMSDEPDMRDKTVCDPALGTGRMILAASNFSYRLYGIDINATVIKAALVNGYVYAPWIVRPFNFWKSETFPAVKAIDKATKAIEQMKIPQFELPGQETAFNLASETAIDGERETKEREERRQAKSEALAKQNEEQGVLL